MARNKYPWVQFYYRDWQTDSALTRCSISARGLWIELLSSFWADGTDRFEGTHEELSRLTKCSPEEALEAAMELTRHKVADGEVQPMSAECPSFVRLVSRRISEELSARESDRKRKAEARSSYLSVECPQNVTPNSGLYIQRQSTETEAKTKTKDKDACALAKPNPSPNGRQRQPDGALPRLETTPEFDAVCTLYRDRIGGIVDKSEAIISWHEGLIQSDADLQAEISDMIHQQAEWREIARLETIKVPAPCKLSKFLRDHRWRDQPWNAELVDALGADDEPNPLDPAREVKL